MIRAVLRREQAVAAVFCPTPAHAHRAVNHLREGAPGVPVFLYTTGWPAETTVALCEGVTVDRNPLRLVLRAWGLWLRYWVAIGVTGWTGERGGWALKLAPFLMPPFRVLVMNENGGFFPGTPQAIFSHWRWRARARLRFLWRRLQDVTHGLALFNLAVVSRRSAIVARRVFRRMRGSAALSIEVPAASGAGVSEFTYRRPRADWAEFRRVIGNSQSRWVLIREEGAREDLEDLLPLFDDERVFAVSRQPALRQSKPPLFARAPVRRLQPGEACQVLAPVAPAMLFDREKLAALGPVETSHAETAWLLLFWKAAAAGFRSYSIGPGRSTAEMPDWPEQDREFVTRLLSRPESLALGPREPDLARGTVSFAVGKARPFRGLPRVLIVSPYLPYPLTHGGAVRIYQLCRALSDRVDLLLAAFREKDEKVEYGRLHEVFREVHVVDRDEPLSRDAALPRQVREYRSRSMRALIADLSRRADLLQVEYTHMAGFRDAAPRLPAILVEHDLTCTLYEQLARREPSRRSRREYQRWLNFERRWLAGYDAVWTMSEEDRAVAIGLGSPSQATFAVPNGVDLEWYRPQPEAPGAEILLVGSFRHLPNVMAFRRLLEEIMPRVWERLPHARLKVVAGAEPQRYWNGRPDSRIELLGYVADLRPLYAGAQVVVAPLAVSAGTNIKVVEALACRRALVTTTVGCAGLGLADGREVVIRDGSAEFAAAVAMLLSDGELRQNIAARGRQTVEERFGWPCSAETAWTAYETVWRGL